MTRLRFPLMVLAMIVFAFNAFGQCDPSQNEHKAKFRTLSASKKAQVWKYQLTLRLDAEDLNPEQRAVMIKAIGMMNASFFNDRNEAQVAALSDELIAVFTKEQYRDYFTRLGSAPLQTFAKVKLSGNEGNDCACNGAAAPLCETCTQTLCTPSDWGCGPFWVLPCNGRCCNKGVCSGMPLPPMNE